MIKMRTQYVFKFITSSLSIFSFVTVNQICDVKINFGPTFLLNTTISRKVLLLNKTVLGHG